MLLSSQELSGAELQLLRDQYGVKTGGDFTVTLRWQSNCDLDLHLVLPPQDNGTRERIYFSHKETARAKNSGLDIDQQSVDERMLREKGGAVENIFFDKDQALQGEYILSVVNYSETHVPVTFSVSVLGGGEQVFDGELTMQVRSFTNYLSSRLDPKLNGKPELVLGKFVWTNRDTPIQWVAEAPPPTEAPFPLMRISQLSSEEGMREFKANDPLEKERAELEAAAAAARQREAAAAELEAAAAAARQREEAAAALEAAAAAARQREAAAAELETAAAAARQREEAAAELEAAAAAARQREEAAKLLELQERAAQDEEAKTQAMAIEEELRRKAQLAAQQARAISLRELQRKGEEEGPSDPKKRKLWLASKMVKQAAGKLEKLTAELERLQARRRPLLSLVLISGPLRLPPITHHHPRSSTLHLPPPRPIGPLLCLSVHCSLHPLKTPQPWSYTT